MITRAIFAGWLGLITSALLAEPAPPLAPLLLRGDLRGGDNQTYRLVPFTVPPGTQRITVQFNHTGRDQRTTVDLGLIGPDGFRGQDGFRGWSGGNKSLFTVSAVDATPSYLPGPITPGEWNLLLGIPNIRADTQAEFTAEVWFSQGLGVADEPLVLRPPLRAQAAWYRGDFHAHTGHSDGHALSQSGKRVPAPAFLAVQAAAERGLDFLAVTEHNAQSHAQSLRELQPYFDRLLLIPGRELTTFHGHANVVGTNARLDFRVSSTDVPTWADLLKEVASLRPDSAFVSINHPIRPSGEACMGCGWTSGELDLSRVQAVEIVNGRDADTPFSGVRFWHEQLNQGRRLTGIGGSDTHAWAQPVAPDATTLGVGRPVTAVFAQELSTVALVAGVRSGRVFVDVEGSADRVLEFTARRGATEAAMGGGLAAPAGERVVFTVAVKGAAGAHVEILRDGERETALLTEPVLSTADERRSFEWVSDGQRHWFRINVRNKEGRTLLIGNPIYINF